MIKITDLKADKIKDCRGKWTIEAEINGTKGAAPGGTSKGIYEAKEIDVEDALLLINGSLKEKFMGREFTQESFDNELKKTDESQDFSNIGGNTSTALSFAFFNHGFALKKSSFPFPLVNIFGGGKHGGFSDIQEFLIMPHEAKSFAEAFETSRQFYNAFKSLAEKRGPVGRNIEGAVTANIRQEDVFDMLLKVAEDMPAKIGIDAASSELWNGEKYVYKNSGTELDNGEQVDFMKEIAETYNLFYAEDPFDQDDFTGFSELKKKIGRRTLVCGDDLTVTNAERLKMALDKDAVNAMIVKPNQIGSVTLALKAVEVAKSAGVINVMSHRSGETSDSTIARLAVNWETPIIKIGLADTDIAKMNELVRLWNLAEKPEMAKL
ncbi:MAG: phosphopyruvate hydratase [Candidatus Aenigmarchaeota archaeon]|nr:phosphopyruvate hydratase [Candidatus Aenigmarchaeota archaeon]